MQSGVLQKNHFSKKIYSILILLLHFAILLKDELKYFPTVCTYLVASYSIETSGWPLLKLKSFMTEVIKTSLLVFSANQCTGFHMIEIVS